MSQSTLKGPGGNATADSNQGEPFKWTSPIADCSFLTQFVEVIAIPLKRDDQIGRPTCLRGELELSLTINAHASGSGPPPPTRSVVAGIDVQVLAYNGSLSTLIQAGQLSLNQPIMLVRFREADTWDRLSINACPNSDGLQGFDHIPGGAAAFGIKALLQASLLMWR